MVRLSILVLVMYLALGDRMTPVDARRQTDNAASTLQGEAMYPRTSKEMWEQVQALVAQSRFGVQRRDGKHQLLITRSASYDPRVLPGLEALNLSADARAVRVQFHIWVFPGRDPARVAVGAILELERQADGRAVKTYAYRVALLEEWFLATLDARAGVRGEPMAATFNGRIEQASRLMPPGLTDPCLTADGKVSRTFVNPVKISDLVPQFPARGFDTGQAETRIEAELTEHGTLTKLTVLNPSPRFAHYEASARGATAFWRFQPTRTAGCPIVTVLTVTVRYKLD
jgi:hypothetical protein